MIPISKSKKYCLLILIIQLLLSIIQYATGILNTYLFAIISAVLVSLSIYLSPLESIIPIFSNMPMINTERPSREKIKKYFVYLSFVTCLLGSLCFYIFKWFLFSYETILSFIWKNTLCMKQGKYLLDNNELLSSVFSKEYLPIVLFAMIFSIILLIYSEQEKNRFLGEVFNRYKKHKYKRVLKDQVRTFTYICFGAGIGVDFFLNIVVILIALISIYEYSSLTDVFATKDIYAHISRNFLLDKYCFLIEISKFIFPCFSNEIPEQKTFILILLLPIFIGLMLWYLLIKTKSENKKSRELTFYGLLKWVFALSMAILGMMQLFIYQSHPVAWKLVEIIAPLSNAQFPVNIIITTLVKNAFALFFFVIAFNTLTRKKAEYIECRNPVAYYFEDLKYSFFWSISLRFLFIYFYVDFVSFSNKIISEYSVVYLFLALLLILPIDNPSSQTEKLKNIFTDEDFSMRKEEKQIWINRYTRFLNLKNIFNLIYFSVMVVLIAFIGNAGFQFAIIPASILLLAYYYYAIILELRSIKDCFDFNLNPFILNCKYFKY